MGDPRRAAAAVESPAMNVRFVVIAPASHACTREVHLPVLVGRSDDAKFRIRDDRISRRHCELSAAEGVVRIRDLGSTNGTFLNDEQLEKDVAVEVPPDAIVRVGNCRFRVEYDSPAAQTAVARADADHEPAAVGEDAEETAAAKQPATGDATMFSFGVDTGKEPTVATKSDAWPKPAADAEPENPPDDDALGNFFKGLK